MSETAAEEVGALHPDRRFFDPFSPRHQEVGGEAPVGATETEDPMEFREARLRRAGATDEEIEQLRMEHAEAPDEVKAEWAAHIDSVSDDDIRADLERLRAGDDADADEGEDEEEVDEASSVAETGSEGADAGESAETSEDLAAEASKEVGGNIDAVLAWVGDDPARISAALEAEQGARQRATLVARLQEKLQEVQQ